MDKVQIYYGVTFALMVVIRVGQAVYNPDGVQSGTHRENFKFFLIALPLMLPVAGRIYGWW